MAESLDSISLVNGDPEALLSPMQASNDRSKDNPGRCNFYVRLYRPIEISLQFFPVILNHQLMMKMTTDLTLRYYVVRV